MEIRLRGEIYVSSTTWASYLGKDLMYPKAIPFILELSQEGRLGSRE